MFFTNDFALTKTTQSAYLFLVSLQTDKTIEENQGKCSATTNWAKTKTPVLLLLTLLTGSPHTVTAGDYHRTIELSGKVLLCDLLHTY